MFRFSIKNFQSLRDVLLDINGLTILRGESGVGKSAVIRCARALLCNRWGRGMISNDSTFCDTAVDFCDGNKLLARKTQDSAIYRMIYSDGTTKDYTAMRREIPDEMGTVFGLTVFDDGTSKELLQIRGQYDRPLLVDVTHKRLSGMLGDGSEWVRCVNADKYVRSWLGQQNGRERGFSEMEESCLKRIGEIEDSISKVKGIKESIEERFSEVEELDKRIALLKELSSFIDTESGIDKKISVAKKIVDKSEETESAAYRLNVLTELNGCSEVEGFTELNSILSVVSKTEELVSRKGYLDSLVELVNDLKDCDDSIGELHSRLASDVCPVCGAKLKEH